MTDGRPRRVVRVAIDAAALLLAVVSAASATYAQQSGAAMYSEWCAVCHGRDGSGQQPERPVNVEPLDFTDCAAATAEPDADWKFVIERGGAAAGLSSDMPEFSLLPADQIGEILRYLRTFCTEPRWPSGNLNLVRALFTTKAFPEDEVALRPMVSHGTALAPRVRLDMTYSRRIGSRSSLEVRLPVETVDWAGGRKAGIGDIALEMKHVVRSDVSRGHVAAVGLEVELATGSHRWGFGEGTVVFEPFVAAGAVAGRYELQSSVRGLIPAKRFPFEPVRHVAYDLSILRPFGEGPRVWAVGVELGGVDDALAVTPQVSAPLTATGALNLSVGVRVPLNAPRPYAYGTTRWTSVLRWDFRDPIRARRPQPLR